MLARNDGIGGFSVQPIPDPDNEISGAVISVRAIKLDDDNKTDLVFIETREEQCLLFTGLQ